jgi:hypothetical protein
MVPELLYKYRSLNSDKELEYVIDTIVKGIIFFGNSFSFNDVFDCRPAVVWDCTDEQFIYHAIKRLRKRKFLKYNFDEAATVRGIRERFGTPGDPRTPEGRAAAQAGFANSTNKFGVFCATSRANNLLMWSHYASSCTGICFELSTAGGNWQKVKYSSDRPKINLSLQSDHLEMLDTSFLIKSADWAYEEEWRIIGQRGPTTIPAGALQRVIFGVNCPIETREKIRKVIYDGELNVGIAMAVASLDHFEFDIVDLDLATPIVAAL